MIKNKDIRTGPTVNTSVYVGGERIAQEVPVKMPAVTPIMAEIKAMGTMSVPVYGLFEDMEGSVTLSGASYGLLKLTKPGTNELECRWVSQDMDANGAPKVTGYRAYFRYVSKIIMPELVPTPGEAGEIEIPFGVLRYQLFIDGDEAILVDRKNNQFVVDGVDYMAETNSLL